MLLVITGTTGRVGRALADHLGKEHEIVEMPRFVLDLSHPAEAVRALEGIPFDALLNPAGIIGLEDCENDPALARQVNALGPAALAGLCQERGARMIHFSTDYVFDGHTPGLREESDPTAPLSIYGLTKRQGEQAVLEAGGTVMRVSWIYGPEKPAFPDQILAAALAGQPMAAVVDKYSLPTYTADLADWVGALLGNPEATGLYHACNGGEPVSWHGMAMEIVAFLQARGRIGPEVAVTPLAIGDLPFMKAPRPIHTGMATSKLAAAIGREPRDWRVAMHDYLDRQLRTLG